MVAYNQANDFRTKYKLQGFSHTEATIVTLAYHVHRIAEMIHIPIVVDAMDARIPITQENGKDMAIAVDPNPEDCIQRSVLRTLINVRI